MKAKAMATKIFWTFVLKDAPEIARCIFVALDKMFSFLEASIPMLIFLVIYAGNMAWTATRKFAPVAVQGSKIAARRAKKAAPVIRGYFIQMRGASCAIALYGAKMGMYVTSVMVRAAKNVASKAARISRDMAGNIAQVCVDGWKMRQEILAEQNAE